MLWVETPKVVLIARDLFTMPTANKALEYPEQLMPCEKKASVFLLTEPKKEILFFLGLPENAGLPMLVLWLAQNVGFPNSFTPPLHEELSFQHSIIRIGKKPTPKPVGCLKNKLLRTL